MYVPATNSKKKIKEITWSSLVSEFGSCIRNVSTNHMPNTQPSVKIC